MQPIWRLLMSNWQLLTAKSWSLPVLCPLTMRLLHLTLVKRFPQERVSLTLSLLESSMTKWRAFIAASIQCEYLLILCNAVFVENRDLFCYCLSQFLVYAVWVHFQSLFLINLCYTRWQLQYFRRPWTLSGLRQMLWSHYLCAHALILCVGKPCL